MSSSISGLIFLLVYGLVVTSSCIGLSMYLNRKNKKELEEKEEHNER